MSEWYSKIEGEVFSQVSYMLSQRTDAPYPELKCTSVNQNAMPAYFPYLYLHELTPMEFGQDLANDAVNAIMHTVEIQVWSNKSQTECKNILASAIAEMKRLRYNIIYFPTVQTDNGISWGAIRARRIIGANDTL